MFVNKIKTLLAQGEVALGLAMPDASEIIAKLSVDTGIDFLWIDLEHRPYGVNEVKHIPEIARRKNCMPMIRVPGLDPIFFKKALDIGANTIMVPQINNAEEAKLAVQYAKYPPEGTRGVSPDWTMFMDFSFDDYLPHANEETAIIAQIMNMIRPMKAPNAVTMIWPKFDLIQFFIVPRFCELSCRG